MTEEKQWMIVCIIEDRVELKSTLIVSQMPIEKWHALIGDFALDDALLDRIVRSSHKIIFKGESLRKKKKPLAELQSPMGTPDGIPIPLETPARGIPSPCNPPVNF